MKIESKNGKLVIILILLSVFSVCSCSEVTSDTVPMEPPSYYHNVTGEDVYETGWYHDFLGSHKEVTVTYTSAVPGSTWYVYFTKEALTEEEMNKLTDRDADIVNSGTFDAYHYDYIYIYCDTNSETSVQPAKDMVTILYTATYA